MKLFTIGHSNMTIELFIDKVKNNGVNCIIDVRSKPYSVFVPHFDKEVLKEKLKKYNIYYIFMGDDLGVKNLIKDNMINYNSVKEDMKALSALLRIHNGIVKGYTIALMCSEQDPIECHRFSVISRLIEDIHPDIEVFHICKDGVSEPNSEVITNMLLVFKSEIPESNLFHPMVSKEERINSAYKQAYKTICKKAKEL